MIPEFSREDALFSIPPISGTLKECPRTDATIIHNFRREYIIYYFLPGRLCA